MMDRAKQPVFFTILAVALGMACLCGSRPVHAEDDKTPEIEKLFHEAVDLYEQGKYAEAQKKLRDVLALDPRKELAARLVDEAGTRIMTRMMADTRMGTEPTYIWQLYKKYYVGKMQDKDRTANLVQRLVDSKTPDDERAVVYHELSELGHYAVAALAPYLKDNHEDTRTYARIALARIGPRAVLPLIELTSHSDLMMRQNAILTLADMDPVDPRAIPALKARIEDPDEKPAVKHFAEVTLKRATGLDPAAFKSAAEYFYDMANRYYLDRAGVAEEAEDIDGMIWHLNEGGDLISVQYPLWAWAEQMAENVVVKGIKAYPQYNEFFPLWACVQGAQYAQVKDLLDIVNEQPSMHSFSVEEKTEIEAWDKKVVNAKRLVAAVGKEHCNSALNKVIADLQRYPGHGRLPGVGVFIARNLAELDPRGDLLAAAAAPAPAPATPAIPEPSKPETAPAPKPTTQLLPKAEVTPIFTASDDKTAAPEPPKPADAPAPKAEVATPKDAAAAPAAPPAPVSALVSGLDSADENVQYQCALSLAQINKMPENWAGSDKVGMILARGVSESKAVQILLVEENHDSANAMRKSLTDLGYGVSEANSGRDALAVARTFPPKDIAIVSDTLRRDLSTDQLIEELRADVRTRYLPWGILHARNDRATVQSRFGPGAKLVERENTGADLKNQVEEIVKVRAAESVTKRKAHEVSFDCALALSKLDPRSTHIVLADAVDAANNALINRQDNVRLACAIFLGNTEGDAKKEAVAKNLKDVFMDANNVVALRREALRSLGRVQKTGVEDVYVKAQADADQEIKDIGAAAFGQISRDNKAIGAFILQERTDKDKKEK